MTLEFFESILFFLLVLDLFWLAWFINVRIDVLFRNSQQEEKFIHRWQRERTNRLLKVIGMIFYSPYLCPIKSFAIFAVITVILIALMRTI